MRPFLLACCALPLFATGCAKSPAGGPTNQTANRIQAQLNITGTLNPTYYYGVAFDDEGANGQGPEAIVGNTPILNGVVGGNFRLLVLYNEGVFRVYYRSTPSDQSTERLITNVNNLFVASPVAGANSLNFTLNLDAQLPSGAYYFPRGASSTTLATSDFDINAVTTGNIIRDGQNQLTKPVDALGQQQVASPVQVQIGGTRRTTITDATGAASDENLGVADTYTIPGTANYVDFNRIDISSLSLAITRSTN